jgi:hypothetical protein
MGKHNGAEGLSSLSSRRQPWALANQAQTSFGKMALSLSPNSLTDIVSFRRCLNPGTVSVTIAR